MEKKLSRLYFVSTGRCGTTRLADILRKHLPEDFTVLHQERGSRFINLLGNLQYTLPALTVFFSALTHWHPAFSEKTPKPMICTDPLVSMAIPEQIHRDPGTAIIHLHRDEDAFARSMYNFTRTKTASFIAHNFIPLWQPHLYPCENLLSREIMKKYRMIHRVKSRYFRERYHQNIYYEEIPMQQLFSGTTLSDLISRLWHIKIDIPDRELSIRKNQSNPRPRSCHVN